MQKQYLIPTNIQDALNLAASYPEAKYIAGGTDALVHYKQKNLAINTFIDITNISELKGISVSNEEIIIGSCTTLDNIASHPLIQEYYPILIQAAKSVASPVIRLNATIGGNLFCENRCVFFNQSEWWRNSIGNCLKSNGDICIATGGKKNCFSKSSSDIAPALMISDAQVSIASPKVTKLNKIPLYHIYSGNGLSPYNIQANELLLSIHLPIKKTNPFLFYKLRQRKSMDFSSLTIACGLDDQNKKFKISIGSADPAPILWIYDLNQNQKENFETWVINKVKKVRMVDNDFFSRNYRKEMLLYQILSFYNKACF